MFDTLIWVKLDHIENYIYLCGVYLWGEDSPAYNTVNVDLFDYICNDFNHFETLGGEYLMGDFNSRMGMTLFIFDCINKSLDDDLNVFPTNFLSGPHLIRPVITTVLN